MYGFDLRGKHGNSFDSFHVSDNKTTGGILTSVIAFFREFLADDHTSFCTTSRCTPFNVEAAKYLNLLPPPLFQQVKLPDHISIGGPNQVLAKKMKVILFFSNCYD